jgi:hypothetical protein
MFDVEGILRRHMMAERSESQNKKIRRVFEYDLIYKIAGEINYPSQFFSILLNSSQFFSIFSMLIWSDIKY